MTVLEETMVESATEAMLSSGFAPRPQVYVLDRTRTQPVLGYVVSRFYEQGDDAASAIANLGVLAAALRGTDLIVFWKNPTFGLRSVVRIPLRDIRWASSRCGSLRRVTI
ncbi:hypothetical protein [Nocardia sp. NPDC004711]